ncbi:MAG: hypothetical protein VCC00_11815 [Deltaproteobacteria bacterium]
MNSLRNEKGVVMIVALGLVGALAGLSLAVTSSGQMSTITGALSAQATRAFYVADGGAFYALGDMQNFVPFMAPRSVDLKSTPADIESIATASYAGYRALPGNLLIRTTDGRVRPAQFGQGEGLGKMYLFGIDSLKAPNTAGIDPASRVQMMAAKPGPCADCGS